MTAATPGAGPLRHATLIVRDIAPVQVAYAGLGVVATTSAAPISAQQADSWGHPVLAGCPSVMLGQPGAPWPLLRLIEHPAAAPRPTRFSHGWLALEILVRDVDALAPRVAAAGFEIVGPPADLDVSPAIRAMQCIGPVGEMLYLTQVKAPVPPFDIPLSAHLPAGVDIGPLFIAVMSVPSRDAAVAACAPLQPGATLRFDTKITVLNRALGRDMGHRWPVATVQWAGGCLFEIDEVIDGGLAPAESRCELPMGLAWVALDVDGAAARPQLCGLAPSAWFEPLQPPRRRESTSSSAAASGMVSQPGGSGTTET